MKKLALTALIFLLVCSFPAHAEPAKNGPLLNVNIDSFTRNFNTIAKETMALPFLNKYNAIKATNNGTSYAFTTPLYTMTVWVKNENEQVSNLMFLGAIKGDQVTIMEMITGFFSFVIAATPEMPEAERAQMMAQLGFGAEANFSDGQKRTWQNNKIYSEAQFVEKLGLVATIAPVGP